MYDGKVARESGAVQRARAGEAKERCGKRREADEMILTGYPHDSALAVRDGVCEVAPWIAADALVRLPLGVQEEGPRGRKRPPYTASPDRR